MIAAERINSQLSPLHEKVIASACEKAITPVDLGAIDDHCREDQQSTFA